MRGGAACGGGRRGGAASLAAGESDASSPLLCGVLSVTMLRGRAACDVSSGGGDDEPAPSAKPRSFSNSTLRRETRGGRDYTQSSLEKKKFTFTTEQGSL